MSLKRLEATSGGLKRSSVLTAQDLHILPIHSFLKYSGIIYISYDVPIY
jgi:hypothetical protein